MTTAPANAPEWLDFGNVNNITSINIGGSGSNLGMSLFMVELDGAVLGDAVNDSQVWSNNFTNADGFYVGNNPANAFDGNPSTRASTNSTATGNQTPMILDISSSPIANVTSVTAMFQGLLLINGSQEASSPSTETEITVDFDPAISLNTIAFKPASSSTGASVPYMKVNGKLLVDQGTDRGLGDSNVRYQTNGGQGNVISVDADNNKILIQDTGNRDNRWIADNQAGTDFAVAGPEIVDKPLLTTEVWLKSSEFATTPEGIDGLKGIIWKLNGVEQTETTDNPYKPTGLTINTSYSVEVQHIGFSLGSSEWSTTTTFQTGASRNLRDYYEAKIAELEAKNS